MKKRTCEESYSANVNSIYRKTTLCRLRNGFMVKHQKCVGLDSQQCPKKGGAK